MQIASTTGTRLIHWLAKLHMWKPATHFVNACKLLDTGKSNVNQAQFELRLACDLAPAWAEPYVQLARCAKLLGKPAEEEKLLAQALVKNSRHKAAEQKIMKLRAWRHEPVMRAWHLYYSGQFELAAQAFTSAKELIGKQVSQGQLAEIEGGIGWCQHDLGAWPEAIHAFKSALNIQPKLAHAWKGLGVSYFQASELKEARQALKQALELEPQLHDARSFLGWCDYVERNYIAAAKHFRLANEGNPLLGDAWWGTAWCLWHTDQTEKTKAAFLNAFKYGPKQPGGAKAAAVLSRDDKFRDLLLPFGFALLEAGQPAAALLRFDRAWGHAPRLEVVSGRAMALLKLRRPAEAEAALGLLEEQDMDQRISALPEHTPRFLRAEAALALNRPELALALLKRAVGADERLQIARHRLDQVMKRLGHCSQDSQRDVICNGLQSLAENKTDQAWQTLQQAGTSSNKAWQVELLRGRIRLAQGRAEDAITHFERSRKAAPHRADAAQEQARLLEKLGRGAEAKIILAAYSIQLQIS